MPNKQIIKLFVIFLAFIFVLSGCSLFSKILPKPKPAAKTEPLKNITEQLAAQSKIKKFENYDELKIFLEQNSSGSYNGYNSWGGASRVTLGEMAKDAGINAPTDKTISQEAGLGAGSQDYSKTNVQVEGVDEADIIKTDGKYIYAVVNENLFIIEARPAEEAKVLSKIAFESRPQDIYVNGDSLVVFGQDDLIYNTEVYKGFKRRGNFTFFKVFDITDKKNPKQARDLDFEGDYSNSRMIGDYVYFVTANFNYNYYDDEMPIPRMIENGKAVSVDCASDKAGCVIPDVYYFDIPYESYNFTSVNAINIKKHNQKVAGDIYLLSGNQNMYVSQNNIYITYTKYISEYQLMMEVMKEIVYPRLSAKDQEKITKIEATENYILNQAEKIAKIGRIIERYQASLPPEEQEKLAKEMEEKMKQKYQDISKELEKTVIHKIAIKDGELEYKASGEVTGQVLNQFSMDENNGFFRIATTKNQTWSRFEEENRESYNNLYVLDENLKPAGALEDLAKGEKIYSVRFMQNRAYMVTFKQMDPLFVIDLADPKNPKVLGELKIPGYSDYLHPYDDTTLIGLGKDTGETEWGGVRTKGLKLSLFDVSNVSEPKEIDTYIMGDEGSDSIALRDHKAFLFSRDKNLLVIPVSIQEPGAIISELEPLNGFIEENILSGYPKLTFSGAAVFKVDKSGFELKGKIDHSDNGKPADSDHWQGYSYYDNTVKRSLYIDDVLYTFSNKYLKMNKIEDLAPIKNLELKKEKSDSGGDFNIIN
jgi:uncharacterized secreted protein with C-terminal beta-propeller domain